MKEALLVILGFALGFGTDWLRRWRARKAHWQILGAEIELCATRAEWYLNRTVKAPLYRLPTSAFVVSFPVLVSEAVMSPSDFAALSDYYSWASDINRGLEYAAEAARLDKTDLLEREEARIHAKCTELHSKYLIPARRALEMHGVFNKSLQVDGFATAELQHQGPK